MEEWSDIRDSGHNGHMVRGKIIV